MRLVGLVVAMGAMLWPQIASADEPIEEWELPGWELSAHAEGKPPVFSYCAMSQALDTQLVLLFSIADNYQWGMALANPDWQMTKGDRYEVTLSIDGVSPVRHEAQAFETDLLYVLLDNDGVFFERFRKGKFLQVGTASGENLAFKLDGIGRALPALLDCVDRYVMGPSAGAEANPFVTPPAEQAYDDLANEMTAREEATTMMANLLSAAAIPNYRILRPAEVPESLKGYSAVWAAGDVAGGLFITLTPADMTALDVLDKIVRHDARNCTGRFGSNLDDIDPHQQSADAAHLYVACSDDEADVISFYSAFARPGSGYYVAVTTALIFDQQSMDAAAKIDERIRDALFVPRTN